MNNEEIVKPIDKEKKHGFRNLVIAVAVVVLVFGGLFAFQEYKEQKKRNQDFFSKEPTLPAITQESFEDLPVGVIYEVSEEDQKQYLEYAKAKYEAYKHLGPQQTDSGEVYQVANYLQKRDDVIGRYNEKPEDMLNEDMSLRYPDMFYGFIIHDESITGGYAEYEKEVRDENFCSDKMNQILFVEDYYLNGGKIAWHRDGLEVTYREIIDEYYAEEPSIDLIQRAVASNFFKSDKEQGVIKSLFSYMFAPTIDYDAYNAAYSIVQIQNSEYFHEADHINGFLEKYNDVKNWDDSYPVYFYPTRVWKIDDNTVVVDITVVNGDRMTPDDMDEILAKLSQSNLTKISENHQVYDKVDVEDDAYVVLGRFFNEDVTQGFMPDLGVQVLNYKAINNYEIGVSLTNGTTRSSYVLNDKAKNMLRDFYKELKEQLANGKTPSTKQILKKVANKNHISYDDAMNIYITHYAQSTTYGVNEAVAW